MKAKDLLITLSSVSEIVTLAQGKKFSTLF